MHQNSSDESQPQEEQMGRWFNQSSRLSAASRLVPPQRIQERAVSPAGRIDGRHLRIGSAVSIADMSDVAARGAHPR